MVGGKQRANLIAMAIKQKGDYYVQPCGNPCSQSDLSARKHPVPVLEKALL